MLIYIISIFPKMFKLITKYGIVSQAIKKNLLSIFIKNPRKYSKNKRKNIDDRPYGGGPGMIMSFYPIDKTIQKIKNNILDSIKVIYLSPQGKKLTSKKIKKISKYKQIILICGRYEGIDQRIIDSEVDEEWSIGDYVVSGGELPAMILIEAICRLIPGVIKKQSFTEESFFKKFLDHPHFTRPRYIKGLKVPKILLSGNHKKISKWRLKQSIKTTWIKRPDLFKKIVLNKKEKKIFKKLKMYK